MNVDDHGLWVAEASVSPVFYEDETFRGIAEKKVREGFIRQTGHDRMTDPVWAEEWHYPPDGGMFLMWNVSVTELPPEPS